MIPVQDVIPTRAAPLGTLMLIALNTAAFVAGVWIDAVAEALSDRLPIFFHVGTLHFVVNVIFLWLFGDNVEDQLGRGRFVLLYLLCGVVAAAAPSLIGVVAQALPLGAAGAIGGVIGAYVTLYPHSRVLMLVPYPLSLHELPVVFFLIAWPVLQALVLSASPATAGNVLDGLPPALLLHAGVLATGALLCLALRRRERARVEWWGM